MIRTFKLTIVFILLCLQAVTCATLDLNQKENKTVSTLKGSRPNIIFVITDDQGMDDLSCMGNEILQTPNIDAFYKRSTRFIQYLVSPTWAPSRAAIMSGRHPFHVGAAVPLLVNENLPRIKPENCPLVKRYYKQKAEEGIPNWAPNKY